MSRMDEIRDKLKAENYKLTRQRAVVLEVFEEHPEEHLSVEDVYKLLLKKNVENE